MNKGKTYIIVIGYVITIIMNKKIIVALIVVAIIAGLLEVAYHNLTSHNETVTLHVLSGAGLMKPMNELVKLFEQRYHVKVIIDYGGSGEIFAKLKVGQGDVFVPGSYYYAEQAVKDKFVISSTLVNITKHIPVIAVPSGNPANIHSLADLLRPGFKIAIGDPKACAIGKVSYKIFQKNGLWKQFEEKMNHKEVILAPTVNQLLLYLVTGQVKGAIVWEDLTTWSQAKGKVIIIEIPVNENIIKTIPAAATVYSQKHGTYKYAEEFVHFISSSEGIKVWEKWGFKPWNP